MSVPLQSLDALTSAEAPSAPSRGSTRTFARTRLLLGISGVGTSVVLSIVWLTLLLLDVVPLPEQWNPTGGLAQPAATVSALTLAVFGVHALLLSVLEYIGGAIAVRQPVSLTRWLGAWLRGVAVQAATLGVLSFGTALAAARFGAWGVLGGVVVGSTLLLAAQPWLARLVARLPVHRVGEAGSSTASAELSELALANGVHPDVLRVVDAADVSFVGGWVGLGRAELWIPRLWTGAEHRELLAVQLARRYAQRMSGARRRGLWRAAVWPAVGLALVVPLLPWSVSDAAFWLALPAVSTLWTFVAVLLLPSVSRPVVYSADAAAAKRLGAAPVQRAIGQLDAWQDDEPERSAGVEFIFHPVPSRGNRERALERKRRTTLGGAHQQTRLTLFTSLAGFGLLGRAVHCNIGRPSLWVVYPGD